jgi:NAD(P)-dependent dehydrogenase (short-subunit alcohol dehydrogenase family)
VQLDLRRRTALVTGSTQGIGRAFATDVDVLVDDLGISGARPALEITRDARRRYFEVNVLSAIRLILASDSAVVTPRRDDPLRRVEDRAAGRATSDQSPGR